MIDLGGKTALVTGASRGIGRAIALQVAACGARVVLLARSRDGLEATCSRIMEGGGDACMFEADLTDIRKPAEAVQFTLDKYGGIDILINNAGITRDRLLMRLGEEEWDQVMHIDLKAVFLFTKAAVRPMMKKRFGRIINIGSVVGLTGNPGQANYAAAKAGLTGFTKSTAKEFASRGITANVVAPGFIASDMTESMDEETRNKILQQIPTGRYGSGKDIAGMVSFLASDLASYITGQVIQVDGGLAM